MSIRKVADAAGPSITLVVALIVLLASLAALLLANSLRGELWETQAQLEEAQGQLRDSQSELQEMQKARDLQQQTQKAKDRQQKTAKGDAEPAERQPGTVNNSRSQDNTKERSQSDTADPARERREEQVAQGRQLVTLALIQGGASLPYLLLVTLALAALASLVLVLISALALFPGSRPGRSEAGSGGSTPSRAGNSSPDRASPLEEPPDDPLEDGRWIKLVEECVEMVDDLDEHMDSFDVPRREVAGHVILRLEEILERAGVEVISDDARFDRARHKPDEDHGATDNGVAVRETLSPGFAIGPRVLRRARVRLE